MVQVTFSTLSTPPNLCTDVMRERGIAAIGKLPPFSPILSKLLASLAGDDVSFAVLGDLIEKDAVLAGRLLGLVNSALYARRGTVSSVRHALSVSGMEKVRNTVLGMSVSSLLNKAQTPPGWSMKRFNKHSAAVAILSDLLAQRVPVEYPEGAFVAGLLHDIGRLLIAIGLPKEFERVLSLYDSTDAHWIDCEKRVLGFAHPELSSAALTAWKVPEAIQRAAAQHHEPVRYVHGSMTPSMTLGWVVRAADQFINSTGESIAAGESDDSGSTWLESLGLDQNQIDRLLDDYAAEHNAIGQYFR